MVEVHQCPSGWIMYSVLLETITYLSVVMMAGETTTVDIIKMPVYPAIDHVCFQI